MAASYNKIYATSDDAPPPDSAQKMPTKQSMAQWLRRPRRAFLRQVARPLQRRYRQLPWATRETVSVAVTLYGVLYILLSVPLRVGFFFNPIAPTATGGWTRELTVLSALDVVSDAIGAFKFLEFYSVWQDAFSLLARSVSFELGKKMSKKTHGHVDKPKVSTRNRQVGSVHRSSQTQWTLATIVPAVVAASQASAATQQRKRIELVLEIVALLPIELIAVATHQYNLIHVLRVTKLCRAYRVPDCLDKLSRIYSERRWVQTLSLTGISSLVRNISGGVMMCHWFACGYMWIAHWTCGIHVELCDPAVESSWVIKDRLLWATVTRKYGRALYWASRTMVMLGYDDVTPVSDGEILYGLFAQLFGAMLSTSLLATFLFIFRHRVSRQGAFNTHVDNAREYMKSQNVPRDVRHQVIAYFSYAWATHHSLDGEESLHLLPKHLESKVVYTLKASRVKQVCFLMRESVEFINLLALRLVHRVYIPSDSIIEPKINAKMFFVLRGTVILSAFDGSRPKECQTGDFFADCCLLTPEKYEEKAVAKTFCELYVLEKAAFDEAIAHFYRGKHQETVARMAQTFVKYATQLRKTKKLLGLRGAEDDVGNTSTNDASSKSSEQVKGWRLPASLFRIRWDIVRLLAIIYVAFEVPYYIVFISNHDAQRNFLVQLDLGARYTVTLLVEIFFVCDFVLRCRFFAYLDPVVMMTIADPAMIFSIYKRNGFYLDLMAVLPVALAMETMQGSTEDYSWVFRLLRMLRLRDVRYLVQDITDYYGISSKIQLIVGLLLGVTLTLHLVACLWFEMSWIPLTWGESVQPQNDLLGVTRQECLEMATLHGNCSWVRYDCYGNLGVTFPFEDPSSRYQTVFAYIRSVYWAVVALTGVGYGDIAAFSTAESYFAAFWIYVSGVINFGIVGAMSSTISNLLASQHHHVEKLNILNCLMEQLNITESLRGEIRRFYHQQFKTRKNAYESQLLLHLPDQLCYKISSLLHSEATKRVPLFECASREFLEEVTGKFRHRTYQNGETLFIEGDVCKEFIVLNHGKVNLFRQSHSSCPVGALVGGDCYGASDFMLNRPHSMTLTAASSVHASVMTREHFDVILRKFEDEMIDIIAEAHDSWQDDMARQKKITANFGKAKLKTHILSTSSLFYQREFHADTNPSSHGGGWKLAISLRFFYSRDAEAVRSRIVGVWNLVLTFWNIYNAFNIVFRIAFHAHIQDSFASFRTFVIIDLVCDAYYLADIYMKVYYMECEEAGLDNLFTREEFSAAYRSSRRLKRDLLASLPLYYMKRSAPLASSLCRLPRLLRCIDLWAYIDEAIILIQQTFASKNISAYLSPLKLLFFLLLGIHYAACVFFLISEYECAHDPTHCWMVHDHILHQYHHSLMALYVRCFYWALTSLTLVGSREIVSRGLLGTMWATVTCLCTTFIMGFILGELSELILDMGKEAKEYKARIDSFEHFAKEHGLVEALQNRVRFFFKTQLDHAKGDQLDEAVQDMPANLKLKLMHEINGSTISDLPISRFLTGAQINNLSLRLKTELFIPGDDIVVEHTFGTRLCILRTGLAAVFWSSSATSVAIIMEGCLFGEIGFFLPAQQRIATVKATMSCEVLYISKHAWNELWSETSDDNHVQQYALRSILGWVKAQTLSYQDAALNVAKRTNRLLLQRKITKNLEEMMDRPLEKAVISKRNVHLETKSSFLTPERRVLEKKAKYLLSRADKCSKQQQTMLADHCSGTSITSVSVNYDHAKRHQAKRHVGVSASGGAHVMHGKVKQGLKTIDLNPGHFFVDVNPVNKHVAPLLDDHHLQTLENECWQRFRYFATLEHTISAMMEALEPRHHLHHDSKVFLGIHKGSTCQDLLQSQRVDDGIRPTQKPRSRLYTSHTDDSVPSPRQTTADSQRLFTTSRPPPKSEFLLRRLESKPSGRMVLTRVVSSSTDPNLGSNAERAAMLRRMKRCHSVPHFDSKYFAAAKREEEAKMRERHGAVNGIQSTVLAQADINFDILQRSRRPKLISLYRLYRWSRQWREGSENPDNHSRRTGSDRRGSGSKVRSATSTTMISTALQSLRASGKSESSKKYSSTQQQQQRHELHVRSDETAVAFQVLVRKLSKVWDLAMLLIALYHAVVTPLKVCFRHDLQQLDGLKSWSVCEYFMDVLCVIDVAQRVRRSRAQLEHNQMTYRGHRSHHSRLAFAILTRMSHAIPQYDGFALDIVTICPLELFVFGLEGVPAWNHLPYGEKWIRLSFFRLNKVLCSRRIEHLSENIFQYAVYDLKLPIAEAMLYFNRSLASFVLMGHWMACAWYAVSEHANDLFPSSWTTFPGMLPFAPGYSSHSPTPTVSTASSGHRFLSSSSTSSSSDLRAISLARKYLRSMHFAFCSITTLWYGDISSLNLLELLVEMLFILLSIYIYGVLVGAQGELLEAYSKREAVFEQNLSELQHYLIQNNVPKMLKKQIKQYYASMWRRRNGEEEFAAIAGISRALHKDVVYATLHPFASKVTIFRSLDIHFLRALLVRLQYVVCSENEEVVIRGDVDRSMYFISEGRILVKHDKSECTKETGEFFGELALLYGIPRGETCIALTVSELYRLDAPPYEELLLEFPEFRAKNRAEWTTAEPPSSMLPAQSMSAAVQTLLGSKGDAAVSASAILDEEVARSFVYKATMEMLAQFRDVDSLQAKYIIARAKLGARKQLKQAMGIETARGVGDAVDDGDDLLGLSDGDISSRPQSPTATSRRRRRRSLMRTEVQAFTPRTQSFVDEAM